MLRIFGDNSWDSLVMLLDVSMCPIFDSLITKVRKEFGIQYIHPFEFKFIVT